MKRIPRRRNWKKRNIRRRPINALASALTTAGLYCGIASIFAAIDQDYDKASYYIFAALVFDMLDGTVAKLTKSVSEFGKQLDSLCDLVSFGAAPAVLIYTAYLHEARLSGTMGGKTGAVFAIIYVICAALRLARFNVYQAEVRQYFVGLPSPGAAVVIASFVLFVNYFELTVATYALTPLTLGLAFLMVSNVRYPKDQMKSMVLHPRNAFRFLVLCAFAIAVIHMANEYSPAIVLFPVAASYSLFGLAAAAYRRVVRPAQPEESPGGTSPSETPPPPDASTSSKTGDLL
jgi:CDP-diacylglycerol--serine O-phosphatidyltransferase